MLVLLPAAARAGCLYKPFEFHPEKNDGVVGFVGKDAYIFKICASKGTQKGCSTVGFVSQVK